MLYDQLFWSIPHLFFHNTIALPELKIIFKLPFMLCDFCCLLILAIYRNECKTSSFRMSVFIVILWFFSTDHLFDMNKSISVTCKLRHHLWELIVFRQIGAISLCSLNQHLACDFSETIIIKRSNFKDTPRDCDTLFSKLVSTITSGVPLLKQLYDMSIDIEFVVVVVAVVVVAIIIIFLISMLQVSWLDGGAHRRVSYHWEYRLRSSLHLGTQDSCWHVNRYLQVLCWMVRQDPGTLLHDLQLTLSRFLMIWNIWAANLYYLGFQILPKNQVLNEQQHL